jgi:acetyl-CoA C-acetyltransferase
MLAAREAFDLQAEAMRATLARVPVTPDEVIVGNVRNSVGNIARVAALEAGVPEHVPAMTVDRQCASSMEALCIAAQRIALGIESAVLVGGVESASRSPWLFEKAARPYAYFEPRPFKVRMAHEASGDPPMGETAEIIADDFGVTRADMDAFAYESHRRAIAARKRGEIAGEIVPGEQPPDECPREDTTVEKLAKLKPAFRPDGRITAGNASPLNDGAASAMVLSRDALKAAGLTADAWLVDSATVGLDPRRMGLGPALAIPRLLREANLTINDIDLFEINEAFAAQVLAVLRMLERDGFAIPMDKLNVNGGAIAVGHPLGATGLRLVVTLVNALRARGLKRGIASLCIGGGQGMAVLIEV